MTDLAKTLAQLSPEKRKLLEQKLKQKSTQFNSFPLSFAQQRMWFLDQMYPGTPLYNIPSAWRIKGTLNISFFERAIQKIVERHEILRTTFTSLSGKAVQLIAKDSSLNIEFINAEKESPQEIEAIIKQKFQHSFDLQKGPLGLIVLIKTEEENHILILVMHHIISDGWSMGILMREFALLYRSMQENLENTLAPLKIQYADFAQWQKKWLSGDRLNQQLDYWKDKLGKNQPAILELPIDKQRQAVASSKGSKIDLILDSRLRRAIETFAAKQEVTTFMFLMAVLQVLLYRYSRQEDITVGTPIANRNRAETEDLIGFFVNTLVIRGDLSGEPTFKDFLQQIKDSTLDAYSNQDLPFEMLVEELKPERSMSHSPLFQVLLVYQNLPTSATNIAGLTIQSINEESGTAKFDLTVMISETGDSYMVMFEYNSDLFFADTIKRFINHYKVLIENALSNPDHSIDKLPILSANETDIVLNRLNETYAPFDLNSNLIIQFENQVQQTPDNLAVILNDDNIPFSELNKKANRLAHYLISSGFKTEQVVAIYMSRSIDAIVAIIAILKAGGAYLPLDPFYPPERIEYILKDSEAPFLITHQELGKIIQKDTVRIINIEDPAILTQSDKNPGIALFPENSAYVIYTSGSTGHPKGTVISHRSALNLFYNLKNTVYEQFGSEKQRISLNAPLLFDASVQQIIMLLQGHCLTIIPDQIRADGPALLNYIQKHEINVYDCVPSQLKLLLDTGLTETTGFKPKALLPGGEAIDTQTWNTLKNTDKIISWNMYGPTECTVDSTICSINNSGASPVIGKPIQNARFYVLDKKLNPVPFGVPGELYISGEGLARGYFNKPALTAEKFMPNPFSEVAGERIYRTGDLVKLKPNGDVEYLSRIDHQVKLRGFRIELGEIEAVLIVHPKVFDAVVTTIKDAHDQDRLIAYYIPQKSADFDSSDLRDFLKRNLPDYMVPALFMEMKEFPMTPNKKVDRNALPKPDQDALITNKYIAPRSETEEKLAAIWREVLNVKRVGALDNFFELGGHSLLATQVISRIRDVFKKEFELKSLFETKSLEELAKLVDISKSQASKELLTPISKISRDDNIPLSFSQQRLWFLDQMDPGNANYNIPVAIKVEGPFDLGLFSDSIKIIIQRHETMRTAIETQNGKPKITVFDTLYPPIEVEDFTHNKTEQIDKIIKDAVKAEARTSFNLSKAPLFRIKVLKLKKDNTLLILNMHHTISDGWSINILFYELSELYRALSLGESVSLPPLPIQYVDFASWQRSWLSGDILAKQISYWKKQLANANSLIELPTDRPRPAVQSFNGAHLPFSISANLATRIKIYANEQGISLFIFLLSAFKVLLYRYSGQDDISVGSPIANRTRADIENLIGFFVNTLVIRTQIKENITFNELLHQVGKTAFDAYAHQDIPFEKIVDAVDPDRDTSYSPLFQVMFVMQNNPQKEIQTADIKLDFVDIENNISKFDLTVNIVEHPQILSGDIEFNTDLFDKKTIERLIIHFECLLTQILDTPDNKIKEINYLPKPELKTVLEEFNHTYKDQNHTEFIHLQFDKIAAQYPENVAVEFENKRLTYAQLKDKSEKIASYLVNDGVGPDDKIAICINRSQEMIISILAVLKAGAAFVPIDPTYPIDRIKFMLNDSASIKLFIHDETEPIIGKIKFSDNDSHFEVLNLDKMVLDRNTKEVVTFSLDLENLAYIIYTSGSTGQPKGTLVTHRGILTVAKHQQDKYQIKPNERHLQFFTFGFDGFIWEYIMALLNGATLVLVKKEDLISGEGFAKTLEEKEITTFTLTPSVLSMIPYRHFPKLQRVITGAEKSSLGFVRTWGKDYDYHNVYGPTEATIAATTYHATGNENRTPPIGKPIVNYETYVLDDKLNPVPIGIPGELCIGGEGLARGYHLNPGLTAEKFIPHPFSSKPGMRLYRTGDLVKYRPDGNIDFIERMDYQVKVRGFRIELGEIETQIKAIPEVKETAVIVREDVPGIKRIVAYLKGNHGNSLAVSDLRNQLKTRLPDYMIPAFFIWIDEIPLTHNRKIDLKALPAPDDSRPVLGTEYVAPQSDTEKILVRILSEILNLKKVGIHDNFFELGGDSIMSIQVIARAREEGLQLSPLQMFQNQTIAALAQVAGTAPKIDAEQGLVTGDSRLIPVQLNFFKHKPVHIDQWNQSVMLQTNEPMQKAALQKTFSALLIHHDVLRSTFNIKNDIYFQHYNKEVRLNDYFIWIDLSKTSSEKLKDSISAIAGKLQTELNINRGPLVKFAYFDCGSEAHRILFIMHHLVVDGVSWRIFLEDFQFAYNAAKAEQPINLPLKSTSFKMWTESLYQYVQSEKINSQKEFWLKQSKALVNKVPVDFSKGENTEESTEIINIGLDESETRSLLQEVPKAYNTQINDILLTALVKGFARWTGRRNIHIHMEGHGREHVAENIDVSRTIGWFTNVYPVYLDFGKTVLPGDQIKTIKEQLKQINENGFSYGLLRYLSEDPIVREKLAVFDKIDILFNYLGQFDQVINEKSVLRPAGDDKGLERFPGAKRISMIDINGSITGGQLNLVFVYSKNQFHKESIMLFANGFRDELCKLISHCKNPVSTNASAIDFNLAKIDNKKLGKVLGKLGKK